MSSPHIGWTEWEEDKAEGPGTAQERIGEETSRGKEGRGGGGQGSLFAPCPHCLHRDPEEGLGNGAFLETAPEPSPHLPLQTSGSIPHVTQLPFHPLVGASRDPRNAGTPGFKWSLGVGEGLGGQWNAYSP